MEAEQGRGMHGQYIGPNDWLWAFGCVGRWLPQAAKVKDQTLAWNTEDSVQGFRVEKLRSFFRIFKMHQFYEMSPVKQTIALEHWCNVLHLGWNARRCKDAILQPSQLIFVLLLCFYLTKSPWMLRATVNRMFVEHASGYLVNMIFKSSKVYVVSQSNHFFHVTYLVWACKTCR